MLFVLLTNHVRPPIAPSGNNAGVDRNGTVVFSPQVEADMERRFQGTGTEILNSIGRIVSEGNRQSTGSITVGYDPTTGNLSLIPDHRTSDHVLTNLIRRIENATFTNQDGDIVSLGAQRSPTGNVTVQPSVSLNPNLLGRIGNLALPPNNQPQGVPQPLPIGPLFPQQQNGAPRVLPNRPDE